MILEFDASFFFPFFCLGLFFEVAYSMQPKLSGWVRIGSTSFCELFLVSCPNIGIPYKSRLILRSGRSYSVQTWWVSRTSFCELFFGELP